MVTVMHFTTRWTRTQACTTGLASTRSRWATRVTTTLIVLVTLALLANLGDLWLSIPAAALFIYFVLARRRCLYATDPPNPIPSQSRSDKE